MRNEQQFKYPYLVRFYSKLYLSTSHHATTTDTSVVVYTVDDAASCINKVKQPIEKQLGHLLCFTLITYGVIYVLWSLLLFLIFFNYWNIFEFWWFFYFTWKTYIFFCCDWIFKRDFTANIVLNKIGFELKKNYVFVFITNVLRL